MIGKNVASRPRPCRAANDAAYRALYAIDRSGAAVQWRPEDISKLVCYAIDEPVPLRPNDLGQKVKYASTRNLHALSLKAKIVEMQALAVRSRRSTSPIMHIVLSWPETEQPTPEQIEGAVTILIRRLKLSACQTLIAAHDDRRNLHCHVIVNRVDPITHRRIKAGGGFLHREIGKAIAEAEDKFRWRPEPGAIFLVSPGTGNLIERKRTRKQRRPSTRACNFETRTGAKSAQRIAIEQAAPVLRAAKTWKEAHAKLPRTMSVERRGTNGGLLWVGDTPIKLSSIGADLSMPKLERRLGRYEPATHRDIERAPAPAVSLLENDRHHGLWMAAKSRHQSEREEPQAQPDKGEPERRGLLVDTPETQSSRKSPKRRKRRRNFPTYGEWLLREGRVEAERRFRFRAFPVAHRCVVLDATGADSERSAAAATGTIGFSLKTPLLPAVAAGLRLMSDKRLLERLMAFEDLRYPSLYDPEPVREIADGEELARRYLRDLAKSRGLEWEPANREVWKQDRLMLSVAGRTRQTEIFEARAAQPTRNPAVPRARRDRSR